MSDMFDKLNNFSGQNNISPDMINNLFNMINKSSNNTSNSDSSSNYGSSNSKDNMNENSNIDFETIMKMKKIIDAMNVKDDPRSNLLYSLKPYLNDSRKSKVDQYIQLMNMSKVIDMFSSMGGDQKKNG